MAKLVNRSNVGGVPTWSLAALIQCLVAKDVATSESRLQISGLRVAQLARRLLSETSVTAMDDGEFEDRPVAIVVGLDTVGAVGLIAAHYLEAWGAWVQVVTTRPPDLAHSSTPEATQALNALLELGVSTAWAEDGWELPPADLLIEAMLTQVTSDLIQLVNSHQAPVLSVGSPSGLAPDTGQRCAHCISARATISLGLPLGACAQEGNGPLCGTLYLADIGLPESIYEKLKRNRVEIFGGEELILLENRSAK